MAVTLNDLIENTLAYLYSFGIERDKVTTLANDITDTDTTLLVADASQVDRGLIEIDLELMHVQTSDQSNNSVSLHPWGRGESGTTAVAHTTGTKITNTPRFPRSQVARELNIAAQNLYPDLYQAKIDVTQRYTPSIRNYPLPADALDVINVSYEDIGPSKEWVQVHGWRMDFDAATNSFPTGKSITFYAPIYPGRTIKIVYPAQFGEFTTGTDTMVSKGLQESWRDILEYQAAARIITGLEAQRLLTDTIESSYRQNTATGTVPTQATQIAARWLQYATQRTAQERRLLLEQHPGGIVRVV